MRWPRYDESGISCDCIWIRMIRVNTKQSVWTQFSSLYWKKKKNPDKNISINHQIRHGQSKHNIYTASALERTILDGICFSLIKFSTLDREWEIFITWATKVQQNGTKPPVVMFPIQGVATEQTNFLFLYHNRLLWLQLQANDRRYPWCNSKIIQNATSVKEVRTRTESN